MFSVVQSLLDGYISQSQLNRILASLKSKDKEVDCEDASLEVRIMEDMWNINTED